jgi:hypothetical protein
MEAEKMVIARISNLLGKITILFVICYLVMGSFVVNTALALDGLGTHEDPWRIESLADFNEFAADDNYWDDYTRLETDVNLAGTTYSTAVIAPDTDNSNNLDFDGTAFTGVFDGNDHKILALTIDDGAAGNYYLGLFGYIYNGEVRNLALEGVSVVGTENFNGGMVGKNSGSVSNCYSTGEVRGSGYTASVGGLVGWNDRGNVLNCYSTCDVNGFDDVGGLVGTCRIGSIENCYSTGDVSGTGDHGHVGGLVGTLGLSFLSNCYSTGDVSGYRAVGGLVGWNRGFYVLKCYSTGDVNGGVAGIYIGGLVGNNQDDLWYCFWDTETQTHGVSESIGNGYPPMLSAGLPTAQMQMQSTFIDVEWADAEWDFINVWNIGENQTYPHLRTYLPSDINKDGIVNFLDLSITANKWLEGDK